MANSIEGTRKPTTVWLEAENEGEGDKEKKFFCFNCRVPLLDYTGRIMQIVPGNSPYTPSTIIRCKGNVFRKDGIYEACGMAYSFVDVIRTQNPEMT